MKLFPAPLTSVVLFPLWLVLARSTSAGHLVLAAVLAIVVPVLGANLRVRVRVRRPLVIVRYILVVGFDVIRSNLEIAWDVIRRKKTDARFVIIPLELRDPVGLAALSMVTTVVPGTLWSELALDHSKLLLHVWDVGEEEAFVTRFKERYEKPLREIFE